MQCSQLISMCPKWCETTCRGPGGTHHLFCYWKASRGQQAWYSSEHISGIDLLSRAHRARCLTKCLSWTALPSWARTPHRSTCRLLRMVVYSWAHRSVNHLIWTVMSSYARTTWRLANRLSRTRNVLLGTCNTKVNEGLLPNGSVFSGTCNMEIGEPPLPNGNVLLGTCGMKVSEPHSWISVSSWARVA